MNKTEQNKIRTIKASCRISVDSDEFSGNFFANIYYINHDSLLLSVSGPFGVQAGTLFIGKNRFIFYNQMTNKFYNGMVKDFENKNFFQFPLKLKELVNIIAGKENLPSMKINTYEIKENSYFINGQFNSDDYSIWIDHKYGHIKELIVKRADHVLYQKEYNDYLKSNNLYFPRKIKMIRPEEKQAVSIYYTQISLNDDIDGENFIINIADNAEQMYFSQ